MLFSITNQAKIGSPQDGKAGDQSVAFLDQHENKKQILVVEKVIA